MRFEEFERRVLAADHYCFPEDGNWTFKELGIGKFFAYCVIARSYIGETEVRDGDFSELLCYKVAYFSGDINPWHLAISSEGRQEVMSGKTLKGIHRWAPSTVNTGE